MNAGLDLANPPEILRSRNANYTLTLGLSSSADTAIASAWTGTVS